MAVTSRARIGDFARLLGFDAAPAPALASDGSPTVATTSPSTLALTLFWQAEGASDVPYAVSVQLLDENGVLRAQHDQKPGGGAFATTGWVQGEVLTDAYRLELPADLAPGRYRLIVRMYDPATFAVLPATGVAGNPGHAALRGGRDHVVVPESRKRPGTVHTKGGHARVGIDVEGPGSRGDRVPGRDRGRRLRGRQIRTVLDAATQQAEGEQDRQLNQDLPAASLR
jgi:hypothetical protein